MPHAVMMEVTMTLSSYTFDFSPDSLVYVITFTYLKTDGRFFILIFSQPFYDDCNTYYHYYNYDNYYDFNNYNVIFIIKNIYIILIFFNCIFRCC